MPDKGIPRSITRRTFLKNSAIASASAALTAGCASPPDKPEAPQKPHIIYILTDQHRGDCLGSMGNPVIKTPHLDSLARDGVCFTHGYTASPSCTPARAGLLTGLSPWHHGMLGYGRIAEKYRYELPAMIRQAGYHTHGIGKMHWFPQKTLHGFHETLVDESGRVEEPGFVSDYRKWFKEEAPDLDPDATGIGWNEHRAGVYALDERLHPTHWTGQTAVDFISGYDRTEPLLLKVSFARPHSPYDPPQRFLDLYQGAVMPPPVVGDWAAGFADAPMTKNAAFGDFGVEHALAARRAYYAGITFIDEQVGRILSALKQKGMYRNALILFSADHGDMLGDHHHWRKTYAYEGSAHIPYLMKWPDSMEAGIRRGARLPQPVELRDFLPTFLDGAGAQVPGDMDGASLLALVRDPDAPWREYIDMEHAACYSKDNYWCALTDGRAKYIYFFTTGEEQFFDLQKDPGELVDLAGQPSHQSAVALWRERMKNHLSERGVDFVKDGALQVREKSLLYSPHYPGKANP